MSVGRLRAKLFGFLAVVVVLVGFTLVQGNAPLLGLDLQGGISIVLGPVGTVRPGALDVAKDIIDSRVNSLGVAEPEVNRQGNDIVVDLPGVANRDKARRLVGQTAELRFRPVLATLPPEDTGKASGKTTTTTAAGSTSTTAADGSTPATTATTLPADAAAQAAIASCDATAISALTTIPTTSRADDKRDVCVVLPLRTADGGKNPSRLLLGPTALTGNDVDKAKSRFQNEYLVLMSLTGDGLTKFNELAAKSFGQTSPQDQVAIVLDGIVQSNPAFQSSTFNGDVSITGNFSATEASDLAKLINYGALPVQLRNLTAQNVSPTLGKDQLRAGIIAGIVGLVLVSIYMLVYYRILGLVVVAGIAISAALLLVVITSFIGEWILGGLSVFAGGAGTSGKPVLTLAGVTGLIVSVGVTVDSYIVYYERLKDEVRSGRTVRTSADRGFTRSFRTILAADLVSFLGAAILFIVAVGSVRGFAFFLGLSTVLDLLVAYFFMHPLVSLMSRRTGIVRSRPFGIAAGLDAPEATA